MLLKLRSDVEWYFLGDFNICFKQKNHLLYMIFCNILNMFDMEQIINDPTRITPTTASVLDLIFSSHKDEIVAV